MEEKSRGRSLGINLSNDSNDSQAALVIVKGLLKHRSALPVDVIQALEDDCRTLQCNIDFKAMAEAMRLGQLDKADRLAVGMLGGADTKMQEILLGVRSAVVERKKARTQKFIGWGALAAIIVVISVINDDSNSGSSYDTSSSKAYDYPEAPRAELKSFYTDDTATGTPAGAPYTADGAGMQVEAPPASYQTNQIISVSELRYCKRQEARLEFVQNEQMSNQQIERFNSAIDDFNSRCVGVRYRLSDMEIIDREIANDKASISAEAQNIIGSE